MRILLVDDDELWFEPSQCKVIHGGVSLNLTAKENALLELLMGHTQKIHSQSSILNQLSSLEDDPPTGDTVRTLIEQLRQKLKTVGADDLIETVYGLGYRLNPGFEKARETDGDRQPLIVERAATNQTQLEPQTRLLIVDEDQEFIDRLVDEATARGMQTAHAPNPQLARVAIERVRPDIVLLDMSPLNVREDGLMLLEELSSQTAIPVLVFISYDQVIDRVAIAKRCRLAADRSSSGYTVVSKTHLPKARVRSYYPNTKTHQDGGTQGYGVGR